MTDKNRNIKSQMQVLRLKQIVDDMSETLIKTGNKISSRDFVIFVDALDEVSAILDEVLLASVYNHQRLYLSHFKFLGNCLPFSDHADSVVAMKLKDMLKIKKEASTFTLTSQVSASDVLGAVYSLRNQLFNLVIF